MYGVKYILNNPVYKGYVRFNNHQNWAVQRRSGKSDKNDVILVKGKHEAIISEEVFDKVHEKLASKSFKPGRPIGGDFYLRGLIKCPECGNNMVCRRTYYKTKKSKERTIKRITFVPYSIVQGVLHVTVIPSMLKSSSVINVHLNRILSQPDIIKQIASNVIEELKQKHSNQTEIKYDIDSLEKQKAKLKTQQERLLELFLDDQMDSEMLKAKQSQMNQQLEVLDQQIKEAQQANQSQDEIPNFDKLKGRLILMITRFSVYLRKATPEAKNQLMKMLIDSIEITTDKQVKLVRYKIDESLIPQSLKKIGGLYAQIPI